MEQHFYFPQGSNSVKHDWTYGGYAHMSLVGNWFDLNEKDVKIVLYNKEGKDVHFDRFTVMSHGLEVKAKWEREDLLILDFIEVGDPFIDGKYDKQRQQQNGKLIKRVTYNPKAAFEK